MVLNKFKEEYPFLFKKKEEKDKKEDYNPNVLVIGDSCVDVFIYGECNRLAPEAPVPVFIQKHSTQNYGMAGNVKNNLDALGLKTDLICNKELITKVRYVEDGLNHMLLRVDKEKQVKRVDKKVLENIDLDMTSESTCKEYKEEKIIANKIIINDTNYYYKEDTDSIFGYKIFEYDESIGGYKHMPEDGLFRQIVEKIELDNSSSLK